MILYGCLNRLTGGIRRTTEFEKWMIKPIKLKGLLAKIYKLLMARKDIDYKWKQKMRERI